MKPAKLWLSVFLYLFVFSSLSFAYSIKPYSGHPAKHNNKLNLAIVSLNYAQKNFFLQDIDLLSARLKKTVPFSRLMDGVVIWRILLSADEEKKFFHPSSGFPPLRVRKEFIEAVSKRLGLNYKLIIIDARGMVSCAELSQANKVSLVILGKLRYKNSQGFAKGFLHELGHALGLADECVNCPQSFLAPAPNCATNQREAQGLWGDLVGINSRVRYINGCCGNKDYLRPTIASLMNNPDKAEDFGPVNERYLTRVLGEK